uniref:Dynein regulatory complex subunit 4 n=2 Tax=Monopterus albus TaxID=43700 RepID=A0A3Q3K0C7_MONAL|nr:growth arrest-specific protein 8-like [Monopterus albus]
MPPKAKSQKARKGKSSSVVDVLSTEEMSKDQLEKHIVRLREELDREREEKSYFQLERDKIRAIWDISKRNLEEVKAEQRNRCREREEAKERHRVEITVNKHKLKHVLSEHHNTISELKIDSAASSALIQNQYTESELRFRRDVHGMQEDFREKRRQNENCMKELKLKHQVELMELVNEYDRRVREVQVMYHKKMLAAQEVEAKKRAAEVSELDKRMRSYTADLIKKHDRAVRGAEEYYYSVTHARVLKEQSDLKEKLLKFQANHGVSTAQRKYWHLRESLQKAEQQLLELQKQLKEYNTAKAQRAAAQAYVKVIEKDLRDVTVQHELLLQAFQKVQLERDELLQRQTEAIVAMQQRSGLKELLLQRKLATVTEALEKEEARLCTALSTSNIEPTASSSATNTLQGLLASKHVTISALQDDVARESKEYEDLLRTCGQAPRVPRHNLASPYKGLTTSPSGPQS